MSGAEYPSNLTDEQWRVIEKLLPEPNKRGRKPIDRRRVLTAILYWHRTGCQSRYLPKEFPHWNTVYGVFRNWQRNGTRQQVHDRLHEMVRNSSGKNPTPTATIIDSQSVRSAEGGE